jgi:adenylate cyclase
MDLEGDVRNIIYTEWDKRDGTKVPETSDVALNGGAVELEATFLYADLAKSSRMAKELDRRVAAKILKSFHLTSCKVIKSNGGVIQSFDGDRVMGVFTGNLKNTNAVKCALQINYAVTKIIKPKFENEYDKVKQASFKIQHGVGIDTGKVLTVRAGAHGNNDLIWIGRAPNLAAKLSDLRDSPYHSFITKEVYNRTANDLGGIPKKDMWEERVWTFLEEKITVYRSSYHWST